MKGAAFERHAARAMAWWGWDRGASALYRHALERHPQDADAYFGLGESLCRQGRWHAASYAFRSALRLRPSEPEFAANLALTLGRSGRWGRAVEALHQLARLRPHDAEPKLLLGAALIRAGHAGRCLAVFRAAAGLRFAPRGRLSRLGVLLLGEAEWNALVAAHVSAARIEVPKRLIQRMGGLWARPARTRRRRGARRPRPVAGGEALRRRAG